MVPTEKTEEGTSEEPKHHPPRGKAGLGKTILAALSKTPGRPKDKFVYWPILIISKVGIPAYVIIRLFNVQDATPKAMAKAVTDLGTVITTDQGQRDEQRRGDELLRVMRDQDMTAELKKIPAALGVMREDAKWLRGVAAGRFRCPDLQCPEIPACPAPILQVVEGTPKAQLMPGTGTAAPRPAPTPKPAPMRREK
ncbi:MAG: hypothetical protein M3P32_07420 [Chloroflexota bacterium]|nr:hypothetical protein [Chloroflexota bacterium]